MIIIITILGTPSLKGLRSWSTYYDQASIVNLYLTWSSPSSKGLWSRSTYDDEARICEICWGGSGDQNICCLSMMVMMMIQCFSFFVCTFICILVHFFCVHVYFFFYAIVYFFPTLCDIASSSPWIWVVSPQSLIVLFVFKYLYLSLVFLASLVFVFVFKLFLHNLQ